MLSLEASPREELKRKTNLLREKKILPAVIYGKEVKNIPISINYHNFRDVYEKAGESTIVNIKIKLENKEKDYPALIREVQKDPLTGSYLHADFFQLPMNEEVEVMVPLEFEGESRAEKELGGILIKNIHELGIKALPTNLIHSIKIDVSHLANFEDEIKIKELSIPEGIKVLAEPEEVVAIIGRPKEEKIEEVSEEEKEKLEEIEVVGGKKEEEDEGEIEAGDQKQKESSQKEEPKKS